MSEKRLHRSVALKKAMIRAREIERERGERDEMASFLVGSSCFIHPSSRFKEMNACYCNPAVTHAYDNYCLFARTTDGTNGNFPLPSFSLITD
jgi:hypothetical protein